MQESLCGQGYWSRETAEYVVDRLETRNVDGRHLKGQDGSLPGIRRRLGIKLCCDFDVKNVLVTLVIVENLMDDFDGEVSVLRHFDFFSPVTKSQRVRTRRRQRNIPSNKQNR